MSFWRHFVELSPPRRDVVRRPDSARAVGNFLFYRIDPSPHVKLTAFAQEMEDNVVWISYGSAIQSEIDLYASSLAIVGLFYVDTHTQAIAPNYPSADTKGGRAVENESPRASSFEDSYIMYEPH